jgi:hypothetical protein
MERDAVLPSSPPHATTDPSSSPFFEPHYHAYSLKSSSPPPLFSSDDSRESADLVNYESPRIFKNKRKGAWWSSPESAHGAQQNKKAKLTRNFDSGVYMMSDSSNASMDSLLPSHKSPFGLDGTCGQDELPQAQISDQECSFLERLYEGLDNNLQTYDFASCDLQDADIEQIGKLASVIKTAPDPGRELPAESQYRSMVPELYVNLSNNKLHHLTRALFDVQNLTTLVLVNNNIEELPACISRLHNLQELNISQNNITSLPFDFLEIYHPPNEGKLELIGDSGVPWLQPKTHQRLAVLDRMFRQLRHDVFEIVHDSESDHDLSLTPQLQRLYAHASAHPEREKFTWYIRDCELVADFHSKRKPAATGHTFTEGGFFSHHPAITRTGYGGAPRRYMARTMTKRAPCSEAHRNRLRPTTMSSPSLRRQCAARTAFLQLGSPRPNQRQQIPCSRCRFTAQSAAKTKTTSRSTTCNTRSATSALPPWTRSCAKPNATTAAVTAVSRSATRAERST